MKTWLVSKCGFKSNVYRYGAGSYSAYMLGGGALSLLGGGCTSRIQLNPSLKSAWFWFQPSSLYE